MTKWNTPLNVFRMGSSGALNTLFNQANYYRLGIILNPPPRGAKCNMRIMRSCKKDAMGLRVKGEKWSKFGKSEANSQRTREKKILPQLISNQ